MFSLCSFTLYCTCENGTQRNPTEEEIEEIFSGFRDLHWGDCNHEPFSDTDMYNTAMLDLYRIGRGLLP